MTLALTVDCLCTSPPARELPVKGLEKGQGTKIPNISSSKAPKFHMLREHSSRTAEMKGIANMLYEACNFKRSVNNVSITFSIAA